MRYEIIGTTMQALTFDLEPGERLYSQTNAMAWMDAGIRMETNTGGGFLSGLKRMFSGGTLFITDFIADQGGHIAFAPRFPGTILAWPLAADQSVICRKETFLCAEKSVTVGVAWQKKLGAGVFGGDGFIMQKITGPGTVWLDLSGEVVSRDLAQGQRLLVHAGHVGILEPSVGFDIQRVKGFRNMIFGGEGLFLAALDGPGRVWLQTMPIMNLAEEIARYLPTKSDSSTSSTSSAVAATAAIGGLASMLSSDSSGSSDSSSDSS